jgi:hypothetical protein
VEPHVASLLGASRSGKPAAGEDAGTGGCDGPAYVIAPGSPKLIALGSANLIAPGSAKVIASGSANLIGAGSAKVIATS